MNGDDIDGCVAMLEDFRFVAELPGADRVFAGPLAGTEDLR